MLIILIKKSSLLLAIILLILVLASCTNLKNTNSKKIEKYSFNQITTNNEIKLIKKGKSIDNYIYSPNTNHYFIEKNSTYTNSVMGGFDTVYELFYENNSNSLGSVFVN